jgi:UDP-N-acetyl-D-glucosamine dehydrogenase
LESEGIRPAQPNIADVRESPGIEVIERLRALGANVDYSDPHVPHIRKMPSMSSNLPASR